MTQQKTNPQGTTFRFAIIGVIVLAMIIPLLFVGGVTEDRQQYFDETFRSIANSWGDIQHVTGPFLIVPEVERYQVKTEAGAISWHQSKHNRVILPSSLNLDIQIDHQFRKRAIYEVPVYVAKFIISGTFPAVPQQTGDIENQLDAARIAIGISHTQAIKTASDLNLDGKTSTFTAGTGHSYIGSGISTKALGLSTTDPVAFTFELEIKGTHELGFTPLGDTTTVDMQSTWPHPSFGGTYLPEKYTITSEGFTANWNLHELSRNLPSSWRISSEDASFGRNHGIVSLFQPITNYSVIDRAIKYGMLFIALTFLGFLCFELTTGTKFHPVQYGVVGIGLVLFYLALLSLSEHISFGLSYAFATALLTSLISWYVWAMTKTFILSLWIAGIVASLYTTLYVLLQLEDYSLLVGTGVLFTGLFALMYTTKNLTVAENSEALS